MTTDPERLVADVHLVLAQAVALDLARPQVAARDRDLLVDRIAVEVDDLHAVEEGCRDRVGDVGGGDEQDLREVELDVQVVVAEGVILCRIEHLEQRRGRIAAPVGADLVDLVEQDHRVHRPSVAQRPHQAAGQSADVGAPVTADLRLVAHAAERHADEGASSGAGDGLADRGLAGARGADQGQDGAGSPVVGHAAVGAQLAHCQVLGDAPLDVLEPGVIGVEHLARVNGVEAFFRALRPRHRDQPVEIGADHRRLARRVAHPLQSGQLALRLLANRIGHPRRGDLGAVLVGDRGLVFAELLADGVHLLAQKILALLLLGARIDVLADALAELQLGEAIALQLERQLQPLDDVQRLQQPHFLLVAQVGRIAGGVGQGAGLGDGANEGADAPVVAAQLENLVHHGAVLELEIVSAARGRRLIVVILHRDAKVAVLVGLSGPGDTAVQPRQGLGAQPPGQAEPVAYLGHHADAGVVVVVSGNEEDVGFVLHVDWQGDVHAGEDDGVVECNQFERSHGTERKHRGGVVNRPSG